MLALLTCSNQKLIRPGMSVPFGWRLESRKECRKMSKKTFVLSQIVMRHATGDIKYTGSQHMGAMMKVPLGVEYRK